METFGKYLLFLSSLLTRGESAKILFKRFVEEAYLIGVNSVFIVSIVATFMGAVTTVQTSYQLDSPFIQHFVIGTIVREMILLELAPTITSIVLAGKVGSSIAGGLGTMRITEQIDTLEVMGINSASYLVMPKIIGSLFVFPLLVILSMMLGLLGGWLAGTLTGVISSQEYMTGIRYDFVPYNIVFALIKSLVFAFLISTIASFQGYYTRGGALEVGTSSTKAVTNSVIAILLADFILAKLLL
jgi:phospholipid/cholesterol/gamma-HCH transport system permease protein